MKQLFLSFCLLCGLAGAAQAQVASIGINTENPQGVLHIDGASTTATTNPQQGSVSAAQASDDVVIDAEGRIGAGVLSPAAKVDIYATEPGGAIRMKDGTQGDRKVLTSDAGGTATWTRAPGSHWYASLHMSGYSGNSGRQAYPMTNYASSLISTTDEGSASSTAGTITVPFTGKYRILFSIHCISNSSAPYWARYILYAVHSGSSAQISRWTPSVWGGTAGLGSIATFVTVLELEEGDVLSISLDATLTNSAHYGRVVVWGVDFLQ
jgi:hypothetical protein